MIAVITVYELINEFANQHELVQRYIETDFDFNGWLSELSIRYLYSSPMYINKILQFVEYYLNPLQQLKQQLRFITVHYYYYSNQFSYQFISLHLLPLNHYLPYQSIFYSSSNSSNSKS
ncbi:unnamed protein product [Anisakis simplex]|uniref:Uncharacterized protein n=1 Tax=Anisakis simplex TaxID=6269 RepID=A0A0M3JDL2_ANISI|nr:unnamed protein product [Anisakis simplex]